MCELRDRVALITGAASGIGLACARRFARAGATVVGFDVQQPDDAGWKEVADSRPQSFFATGDVRDETGIETLVGEITSRLGGVDVLVNAAGVAGGGPVHLLASEEWDRVLDVNLKGTYLATKHVLPSMLERGAGSVINIASIEGLEGVDGGSAYNASKGGVVLLTRNLAIDYGRRGIRANCICPGLIDTPLTAGITGSEAMRDFKQRFIDAHHLGRLGRPEEIAAAALFLASDDASFVTGHALAVDGGVTAGHAFGARKMMGLE